MLGNLDFDWNDVMGALGSNKESKAPPQPRQNVSTRSDRQPPQDFVEPSGLPPNWDTYNFTYKQEVGAQSGKPHVPSDNSGVTIGPGFDLSVRDPNDVIQSLTSVGVPKNQAERLSQATGLTGEEARKFIRENADDINLDQEQEARLFLRNVPKYEERAIRSLDNMGYDIDWNELDREQKSLLFDYTYNLGSLQDFEKFTEAVIDRDWDKALKEHKRYTGGKELSKRNKDTEQALRRLKQDDFGAPPSDLSKQEKNIVKHHRNNLRKGTYVHDDRGLATASLQAIRGPDEKMYAIPSVIGGERRSVEDVKKYADKVGWENFPSFTNTRQMNKSLRKIDRVVEKDLTDFIQKARRTKKGGARNNRKRHPETNRPILHNPDGSISTEESITITNKKINDGEPTNIPTIWGGKRLSEKEAVDRAAKSEKDFPSYSSIEEAVEAAKARSKRLGQGF